VATKWIGLWSKLAIFSVFWANAGIAAAQTEAGSAGLSENVVTVELKPASAVDGRVVTLDAIAVIRGGNPALRQLIGGLDVAEFAAGSKTAVVSLEQVMFRIQIGGIEAARFMVDGSAQAMITLSAPQWSEEDIIKAAQVAIGQRLGADLSQIQFELVQRIDLPNVPAPQAGELRMVPDLRTQGKPLGRVRVDVRVIVDKETICSVPVTLDVACYQQIAVAGRRMDNGETLQREDIRSEKTLVHGGENYVVFSPSLVGQRTLRSIPAGQALTSADIELAAAADPVLVKNRDNVRLIAVVGSMQVSTYGQALQDGRNGQMIQVRNVDSNHVVFGRVVGQGIVEVEH
jgi:flagellar basal body P-ring formation protein FlgA